MIGDVKVIIEPEMAMRYRQVDRDGKTAIELFSTPCLLIWLVPRGERRKKKHTTALLAPNDEPTWAGVYRALGGWIEQNDDPGLEALVKEMSRITAGEQQ